MNKLEKKVYDILVKQGYLVEKPIKTKWHRIDLWGCWDFVAVNNQHIRFIQVSTKYFSQKSKKDQETMLNFPQPPCSKKEYWHWDEKRKQMRITLVNERLKQDIIEAKELKKMRYKIYEKKETK